MQLQMGSDHDSLSPSHSRQQSDDPILSDENYSNPVDLVKSLDNRSSINRSLERSAKQPNEATGFNSDDDIYILPVAEANQQAGRGSNLRPTHLEIRPNNCMTDSMRSRDPLPDCLNNIAAIIDPTYCTPVQTPSSVAALNSSHSPSGRFNSRLLVQYH